MPTPSLDGFTLASGSLSTLDRYSAYGVMEPNVALVNQITAGSLVWDFVDIAVHPIGVRFEYSASSFSFTLSALGSNDGLSWETLTLSGNTIGSSGPLYAAQHTITTTKFFRYLKLTFSPYSGSSFKFHAVQWNYDTSRAVDTGDGGGGVDPDTGEGGGANDPGGVNDPSTHAGFEMSDLSVYAGDMVLGWIKGTDMTSAPAAVYVALFDGDPDDTGTPGVELTGANGLTRQEVTFGPIVARYMLNTATINFGALTADKTVACFCLFDDDTAGNRITKKMLDTPAAFTNGTPVVMRPGKLPVYY